MASAANVATSYSPGGANVHFYLAHGSFGPYMCPDPRRRLNRFSCFLRGSRLPVCPAEKYGTSTCAVIGRIYMRYARCDLTTVHTFGLVYSDQG